MWVREGETSNKISKRKRGGGKATPPFLVRCEGRRKTEKVAWTR